MKISEAFLTFRKKDGDLLQISIADLLHVGPPITDGGGDELQLEGDEIEEKNVIVLYL